MELMTQEEVEKRMYYGGIKRAETTMKQAEEHGRAHTNPYAQEVLRDYVLPLADVIRQDVNAKKAGAAKAHVSLLRSLDPEAVALLAVRTALNCCMNTRASLTDNRSMALTIGTSVHSELVLTQIEDEFPDLYYVLTRDLARRQSKNERHRTKTMRLQAEKQGYFLIEWPIGAREQVGYYLMGLMHQAGMIEIGEAPIAHGKVQNREIAMAQSLMDRVSQIKSYIAITAPTYGPCVEPPKDWVTPIDGGFHTKELRRSHPIVVSSRASARHLYREAQMPVVLAAVNALQRTQWRVNERILGVLYQLSEAGVHTDEIVSVHDKPKPPVPGWLKPGMTKEQMTEQQANDFHAWKRLMSEWYTEKKLSGTRFARFYAATRAAEMFRGYPALHFVYFADSRGRLYPMTYGVNPQGSDLQKALLEFGVGKPLVTEDAIRWFHIQGANKWGFDKATLSERFMFAHERKEEWLHYSQDPVNNRGWLQADSPLQFLAWCFEYAAWCEAPDTFLSRVAISMDGSCNGLQNLSAMLRDEVGGRATNLTNNEVMEDIYRRVSEAATVRLSTILSSLSSTVVGKSRPPKELAQLWLSHGLNRTLVKRSVMTTPYGVTMRSATDYVIEDYLKKVTGHPFEQHEYRQAAQVLMQAVWPAIGDVVVKGRQAMDWLKKSARLIVKDFPNQGEDNEPIIWWTSPSGFPASQSYFEVEVHRINTRLIGPEKIRVVSEVDEADVNKHASGLAPNFVHSMDAAHLHLVAAAAVSRGIGHLAMIHDDYGTHAADAQVMFDLIREMFVWMYEKHDPIAAFHAQYPVTPAPPEKGNLNIREVLDSKFFFS